MLDDDEFDLDLNERCSAAMQAGAQASGIPWQPLTDVQRRECAAYADAMAAVSAMHICGILDKDGVYDELTAYDTHDIRQPETGKLLPQGDMILQMLAAERYRQYMEDCQTHDERLIDPRKAPSYDEMEPLTANRLYVLTYRYRYLVPLEIPYDWQAYLGETPAKQTKCDVHLLHRCWDHQATPAAATLVYKRGEILYAFKTCDECRDALSWIKYATTRVQWKSGSTKATTVKRRSCSSVRDAKDSPAAQCGLLHGLHQHSVGCA